MAINTTTRQTTAFTSGQTFAFAFKVYEEGDVKVIRITNSTGAEEVLTITTHYTVTLNDDQNANPGGSITLVSSGSPVNLGSGFSIVITSKVTPLQQTEITNQGGFFPEVINDVLDKAAILDQQQQSILDKTIRFPLTQTVGGLEITENAANRANKTLVFDGSGDLSVSATVDGRDVSADGAKLDTIEANAKDDQTAAEIRALVESASDSNVFTDQDHSKLNGIEAGATGDLSASEVKALYEGNSNTNAFTDAQVSKLNNIEAGATGDQSASEIRTLVESASDSNVFTDNDHSKLNGIETGATADQTSGDIKTLLQSDKLTASELANNSVTVSQIQDSQITAAKLDPAAVITASEQASATPNDTSFLTSAAADARFFNISTGDTIKDGQTFPDNDTTIATTAAINDRIIDLINDVGGFDIIESEQHFPNTNPQGTTGQPAVLSVKAASTNLVPSGTTVTINNGNLANNANITITGVPSTIPSGFGFLVESTGTIHEYAFHRLVPKATEVTTVAGKAVEIGRLGTADAVADMNLLATTDVVADMNMLATSDVIADMNLLATTDVIADMNLLAVADVISNMDTVATNVSNVNNVGNNISNVNNLTNSVGANQTFNVTVQNVSGNKYFIDGVQTPVLKLARGKTYTFNLADSSNSGHPLAFRDSSDNAYTTGVTTSGTAGSSGATVVIVVAANAPNTLKYYCTSHGNSMGNTINVIDDNVGAVAGSLTNVNNVAGALTNVNNVGNSISDVNAVANNLSGVNAFASRYDFGASNPTTNLDVGDLFFNTSTNSLKVYTGSAWVDGVTTTGNFALLTGNTFTGNNIFNDNVKAQFGTGSDLEIFHDGSANYIKGVGNHILYFATNNTTRWNIANDGHLRPQANQTYDIGSTVQQVKRVYSKEFIALDDGYFKAGNSADLQIYHDGSNSYIKNYTGTLFINGNDQEKSVVCIPDGAVELYYDNNKKFETTSTGIDVTGAINSSGDITITNLGPSIAFVDTNHNSDYRIKVQSGLWVVEDTTNNNAIRLSIDGTGKLGVGTTSPYTYSIATFESTNGITLQGSSQSRLLLRHTGGGTDLKMMDIQSSDGVMRFRTLDDNTTATNRLIITSDGHIDIPADNKKLRFGASQDLEIYHDGSSSYIDNVGTGNFFIRGNNSNAISLKAVQNKNSLICHANAQVQLYYDNSLKFETTSTGASVTGTITSTGTASLADGHVQCQLDSGNGRLQLLNGSDAITVDIQGSAGNVRIVDNGKFQAGSSNDLQMYHDGTSSILQNSTGIFYLGNYSNTHLIFQTNNTNRWAIRNDGHFIPDADSTVDIGSSSTRVRNLYADTLYGDGSNLTGINTDLVSDTSPQLGGFLDTNGSNIKFPDSSGTGNNRLFFGSSDDLSIYHDGSHSKISNSTGYLVQRSNQYKLSNLSEDHTYIKVPTHEQGVELYYDNVKMLETIGGGVKITGGHGAGLEIENGGTNLAAQFKLKNSTVGKQYTLGVAGNTGANGQNSSLVFRDETANVTRAEINTSGHFLPGQNNTYDLGSSSRRWRNIYTNDLNLSNEGGANDVDKTWGSYTIQEGAEDLFLINKRNGKKYKFALMEVS